MVIQSSSDAVNTLESDAADSISLILKNLPRLLYVGDVPVESTVAGSALLYRLLQNYPVDRLQIIETNIATSSAEKRLTNITYQTVSMVNQRMLNSRFTKAYSTLLLLAANYRLNPIKTLAQPFRPEAILTVAHGLSWLTAAALADALDIPLHLIVHDDWPSFTPVIDSFKTVAEKKFQAAYRQARSKFCVSPYMAEKYKENYGLEGTVLYPSRANDAPHFTSPPERVLDRRTAANFAYAGSIHSQGQANNLIALANVIRNHGGTLFIYSPLSSEGANQFGLDLDNIVQCPIIPSEQLIQELREKIDILFAPMNFDPGAKANMKLCFPSKLTDYTITGLPLLIWGPSYCSAIQWANSNPGVAETVEDPSEESLEKAVVKLLNDPEYRHQLAIAALNRGQEYFSHQSVQNQFYAQLIRE